jgi:Nickel responsive protein SCO4226-like
VTTENAFYNIEADRLYCILNAPNEDAVKELHKKFGAICDWILEIKTSA